MIFKNSKEFLRNPQLNLINFAIIYSLINLALFSQPIFLFAFHNLEYQSWNGITIIIELIIAQFCIVFLLVIILSFIPIAFKSFCIFFFIANSIACFFINQYNIILDKTMMSNVFNTNFSEANQLFNPKILLYLLLLGIIPSFIVYRIKILFQPSITKRIIAILIVILATAIFAFINSKTWLWIDKNAKHLGGLSMPLSYSINSIRYLASTINKGKEIQLPEAHFIDNKNTMVFLVIGESARKANFSLYGYHRLTNPLLKNDEVIAMKNTTSCTTYTTESIKCMLSHLGSKSSSRKSFESLPVYLQRHNINVLWRSNNWGEPKMKLNRFEKTSEIIANCKNKNCQKTDLDEALLYNIDQEIKKYSNSKSLIILHQNGSHGPNYHSKYPAEFEKFIPVCKSVELQKCSKDELINAYDNTIVYNDYFLHQLITILKKNKKISSLVIYISDHGESLGEYNFYLHGMPYSIAPDYQKEIPFIIWASDKFKKEHNISNHDLSKRNSNSQDNIFHSVMSALGLRSEIYNKDLDIFSK